jgi:NAD(P)H-dependent FMN reductase
MKTILFLVGSLRVESMNRRVSLIAERMLPEGYEATRFDLIDVPIFNADLRAEHTPASVTALRRAIEQADGVFWTSPEYNFALPSVVKNAIDWACRPMLPRNPIVGKPMNVVVATESPSYGARALADIKRIWGNCAGVPIGFDYVVHEAPSKFVMHDGVETFEPISRKRLQLNIDNLVRAIDADVGAVTLANWDAWLESVSS